MTDMYSELLVKKGADRKRPGYQNSADLFTCVYSNSRIDPYPSGLGIDYRPWYCGVFCSAAFGSGI